MKIFTFQCPNCGAPFNPPHPEKKICFCSNCGTKMIIDNGELFVNVNITKNINKSIKTTKRIIDDAKIEKQKTARFNMLLICGIIGLSFLFLLIMILLV